MQHDPNHPSVKRNYAILLRDFPELRTPSTERSVGTPSHVRHIRTSDRSKTVQDGSEMPLYQPQIPIHPNGRSGTPKSRGRSRSPNGRRSRSPAHRRSRSPGGRRSQSPARTRRLASRQGTPQVVRESSLDVVVEATPRTEAGLRSSRRWALLNACGVNIFFFVDQTLALVCVLYIMSTSLSFRIRSLYFVCMQSDTYTRKFSFL